MAKLKVALRIADGVFGCNPNHKQPKYFDRLDGYTGFHWVSQK